MKYWRYGKIRLENHVSSCCFALFFLIFGIADIAIGNIVMGGIFFIGIAILDVTCVLMMYREKFSFDNDHLIVYKDRMAKEKKLSEKMTVVLSYADVCTDLAKRVSLVNNTYILKGEWAISLLDNVSVEKVIKRLHGKNAYRYTNCWVEYLLKQHFVYSFVCNQSMLEEVLIDKNFIIIIPEFLLHMIDTKKSKEIFILTKDFEKGFL